MPGREVPFRELDLPEPDNVLSPPVVDSPLYSCTQFVQVISFHNDAEVTVQVLDNADAPLDDPPPQVGDYPEPDGMLFELGVMLEFGMSVRAMQRTPDGRVSDWSVPEPVREYTEEFPLGPPRPRIAPAPVFDCGVRTGVANLLIGSDVSVLQDGAPAGSTIAYDDQSGVNIDPPHEIGEAVVARTEYCGDSVDSAVETTQVAPDLTVPEYEPEWVEVNETSRRVLIGRLANGSWLRVSQNGVETIRRNWGGQSEVTLPAPAAPSDTLEAVQWLCPDQPESGTGTGTVRRCSDIPAPRIAPIQAGDDRITIVSAPVGSIITVWVNGVPVASSAGPVIPLPTPLSGGDTVVVAATVGSCAPASGWVVDVPCVDPPLIADPAADDFLPVGYFDFDTSPDGVDLETGITGVAVGGSVYYPATTDGERAPLSPAGPFPFVVIAHGNHDSSRPSYRGYVGLQRTLARQGFVAVSVNHNAFNRGFGGTFWDNIRQRARHIAETIRLFHGDHAGGGANLAAPLDPAAIDFERIGLVGHSRGGDAVCVVQHLPAFASEPTPVPGAIGAVLSLAPTDAAADQPFSGGRLMPTEVDFVTILPAADGDVATNPGCRFYDLATAPRSKSQLYVFDTNHNRFNTIWEADGDDHDPATTVLLGSAHRRVLVSAASALFRSALQGNTAVRDLLLGRAIAAGLPNDDIHVSFAAPAASTTVVDDFERPPFDENTLGLPNTLVGGYTPNETSDRADGSEFFLGGTPTTTYYGETTRVEAFSNATTDALRLEVRGFQVTPGEHEIWVRAAEWHPAPGNSRIPDPNPLEFEVGVEDGGAVKFVSSAAVGGIPPIFEHRGGYPLVWGSTRWVTKTMFVTLRFPISCYTDNDGMRVDAIHLRNKRTDDDRRYVFDDIQIVRLP